MQPCFTVAILVLQAEGLVCAIRYLGFLFQTAPAGIVAEPQQIAVLIGHLPWDADLVAVEVVGLLAAFSVFVGPVMYQCQRFVTVGVGVDIGIPAVRFDSCKRWLLSQTNFRRPSRYSCRTTRGCRPYQSSL